VVSRLSSLTLGALSACSEDAKGAAQSSPSQLKQLSFVSLRDAHADAWQRTREGNSRMPKLFATISGTTDRPYHIVSVAL
jgi:hypothetical protein